MSEKKVREYMKTYNSFSGTDMVATMYIPGVEGVEGAITLGSLQTISYSIHMERSPIRAISNINAKTYVMGPRTIAGSLVFAVFDKHFAYEAMKKLKGNNSSFYFLADELPPFDVTITFANEYGQRAKLALYGIRLIDEGQVMSINDILTENTYQFVATDIDLLSDNVSSAGGDLIYEGLTPNQPITDPAIIEWEEQISTSLDDTSGEYDYALRAYVSKNSTSYDENGMVELNFYGDIPTEGKIVIHLYNEIGGIAQWVYHTTVTCTPNTQYPAQIVLGEGDYKAQYFDINEQIRSKYVEFSIVREEKKVTTVPTPTVEEASVDKLVLNIGEGIDKVLYREVGKTAWIVKENRVNNKKMILSDLKPSTKYEFRAHIGYFESEVGYGITLNQVGDMVAIFKDYLIDNQNVLKEYGISVLQINIVAEKANEIYLKNQEEYSLSFPIAMCVIKALEELSNASTARMLFSIPEVTEKDVEILAIEAARYENRYAEVKNINVPSVKIIDNVRGYFLAPLDTKQLIIEKQEGAKRIIASSKMKKRDDGFLYESQLDKGVYEVYSISNTGVVTSKKIFVSVGDTTKKELIVRQNLVVKDKTFSVNTAKEEIVNYLGNLKEKDELYTQWSIINNLTQSDAVQPEIIEIKNSTVTIMPVSPINVLPESLYLCIEDLDKVQDQATIRKIKVYRIDNYKAILNTNDNCLVDGRRYAVWYQEIETVKKYRPTCFVFKDDFDENDLDAICAKKDRDILLKQLYLLATKTDTTYLLDYINNIVTSIFEDSTQNLEKSINNIVETMYNENMLTKKNLCDSICLVFSARNAILSRYNNQDLSDFIVKGNLAKAKDITKTVYLKRFVVGKDGIHYLDPVALAPGQSFDLSFYDENNQITGFYLIESDKEKVGLPTIMDASTHLFYGRRTVYDNQ